MERQNRLHRKELKIRRSYRIFGSISRSMVRFEYGDELFQLVTEVVLTKGQKVQYREPREIFESLLQRCRERTVFRIYPMFRRQMQQFQYPGLSKKEKEVFRKRVRYSRISRSLSFLFFSSQLLPQMQKFFDSFSKSSRQDLGELDLRISSYLNQRVQYTFLLLRIFQIPVLFQYLLEKERRTRTFRSSRRTFRRQIVIVRRIVATRRTPPDVGSQLIVGSRRILRLEMCRLILCRKEAKKQLEEEKESENN